MNIILASASPRRKELLEQLGVNFVIQPSTCEELITKSVPCEVVLELATLKAYDIFTKNFELPDSSFDPKEEYLILGADTIVAYDTHIMGKPKDETDAFCMLKQLQGNVHQVYTGVCALRYHNQTLTAHAFYECTDVHMYPMTDSEIYTYISTREPMDKAGSYAIQGRFAKYIQKIDGDYNTVVGLPIARLWQELFK